ncbi:MAG: D-TA family PLP-dependent enzyme [Verrucomicrobiales bacterium]|nr:D-TA family PLP-dependent enzyme [Verrucomicrobiales bacterium]
MNACSNWWRLENEAELVTPGLLIYEERVERNLARMLEIAGGAERLRPHVKTHKMARLIEWQVRLGVRRFKASTVAEVEMCAEAGAEDVLLAMPGAAEVEMRRLRQLVEDFPEVSFSVLVDSKAGWQVLETVFEGAEGRLGVMVDVDCGMGRTGIAPGDAASELVRKVAASSVIGWRGLHVYDGHIHEASEAVRRQQWLAAMGPVEQWVEALRQEGLQPEEFVCGGSPTFGLHAAVPGRRLSPGTTVFWDFGYGEAYEDLDFLVAAVLVGRVVSRTGPMRATLNLGYKTMAAERPLPRVRLLGFARQPEQTMQSEEHLVIEGPEVADLAVGTVVYAVPRHICPTVSMFDEVGWVRGGQVVERVPVTARGRRLTV